MRDRCIVLYCKDQGDAFGCMVQGEVLRVHERRREVRVGNGYANSM